MANEFDQLALDLIADLENDFLKTVTLRKVTPGTYNPTTGATTAETVVDTSVKGAIQEYRLDLIDDAFEVGDFMVELYTSTALDLDDRLVIDSVVHKMVRIITKRYAVNDVYSQLVHVRGY